MAAVDPGWEAANGRLRRLLPRRFFIPHDPREWTHGARVQARREPRVYLRLCQGGGVQAVHRPEPPRPQPGLVRALRSFEELLAKVLRDARADRELKRWTNSAFFSHIIFLISSEVAPSSDLDLDDQWLQFTSARPLGVHRMTKKVLRPLEVSREPLITNKLVEVKEEVQSFLVVCRNLRGAIGMGRTGRNRHIAGGWAVAVVFGASWCKVGHRILNSVHRILHSTSSAFQSCLASL
jgi:hypothetical protein